ncbi:hypothetical protein [Dyadobacter sp. 3J3]|uniref:hypothetical protein n=1 Tax=Dyadobacter sp. 3J3 TaxID=2606600 RepID=UPI001E63C145|nr:hypothetical protein [Dyadobacter sp. 3J3]
MIISIGDYLYPKYDHTYLHIDFNILKSPKKQWISLGLLGLMLIKVWVIPLLYLDFEIRRDYIVKNLCINRERPLMLCNGKCYLAKKMAALDEQEKRQAESDYMTKLLDHVMDSRQLAFIPFSVSYKIRKILLFNYTSPPPARIAVDDIFHPPA